MSHLIVAIDPSSGASSAVGVAILTPDLEIIDYTSLMPRRKYQVAEKRLVDLHEQLELFLAKYVRFAADNKLNIEVVVESTIMQGRAGETLAEAVGALASAFPNSDIVSFHKVHNTSMKRIISGTGKGDKVGVAKGLLKHISSAEHYKIISLLNGHQYDILDAIAIGTTHILGVKPNARTRATSRKKSK
jgi:Holliday junction resolvasome RuvABC endonuclease subunit